MTMLLMGELPKFDGKQENNWQVYVERLEQFFDINEISEDRKKSILLMAISEDVYKMLRDICYPTLPKYKSYTELREHLNKQFNVKLMSIGRERYKFYNVHQKPNETITGWFSRLKRLSVECKFESTDLDLILLDRFVSGLNHSSIMDRLCEETENITLQMAIDFSLQKESSLKEKPNENQYDFSNSMVNNHSTSTPLRRTNRKRRAPAEDI